MSGHVVWSFIQLYSIFAVLSCRAGDKVFWSFIHLYSIFAVLPCSAGDKVQVVNSADENWWEV